MTTQEIKKKLNYTKEYDFLSTNPKLGQNIVLLTVGGSHAYGTNTENSDLDIRGCALNSGREILLGKDFEQVVDRSTDTVIYSFKKLISLLTNANPNVIEMLGCKPEHYFYLHPVGQELIDNAHLFLSKKAIQSFGGYATQQLRRLENKANRYLGQTENEKHILDSIENASYEFKRRYPEMPEDAIKLFVAASNNEELDSEIFMNINLTHYPLRDYVGLVNEMQSIVRSYNKLGKRNENAMSHDKLGKHSMHLIRLYMMCLDILEKEQIITYREKEHDLLMDIRNGKYLDSNSQPTSAFFDILNEYEKRFEYAKKNTALPDEPDYEAIDEFVSDINGRIIRRNFTPILSENPAMILR